MVYTWNVVIALWVLTLSLNITSLLRMGSILSCSHLARPVDFIPFYKRLIRTDKLIDQIVYAIFVTLRVAWNLASIRTFNILSEYLLEVLMKLFIALVL
jgi:hypothetical protein